MISGKDKKIEVNFVSCLFVCFLWELRALRELMISGKEKTKRGRSDVSKVTTVTNDPSRRQLFTTNNNYIAHRNVISNTGSVGAKALNRIFFGHSIISVMKKKMW